MNEQDVIDIATASNGIALQWYLLTHPQATANIASAQMIPGGVQFNAGSNTLLIVALVIVGAVIVLSSNK